MIRGCMDARAAGIASLATPLTSDAMLAYRRVIVPNQINYR